MNKSFQENYADTKKFYYPSKNLSIRLLSVSYPFAIPSFWDASAILSGFQLRSILNYPNLFQN